MLFALVLAGALGAPAFTPADWTALRSATAVDVSRDGRTILYDVAHGAKKGPTVHEWWTISSSGTGARRLTIPKGFDPAGFSAQDELFGTYSKPKGEAQVALLRIGAKLPRVLTHLVHGAGPVALSPDGRWIATLASNEPVDPLAEVRTVVENAVSTPYVVRTDGTRGAWWCPGYADVQELAWSPDSREVAILTQNGKIGFHLVQGAIARCSARGAVPVTHVDNAAASIAWMDSRTIAFLSTATPTLTPEHVYTVPAAGGTAVDRTPNLQGTALALKADSAGNTWVQVVRGVQAELDRFAGGALVPAYRIPNGSIDGTPVSSRVTVGAPVLAFTADDTSHAANVYVARGAAFSRITHEGDALLGHVALGRVRVVHWRGPATPLTGILTLPPGYIAGRRYPFVNLPHGGPEANDTLEFDSFSQLVAAQGYVVLQTEYRGSTGVNSSFTAAIYQHFGDRAYADVDSGTDYAISAGYADPKRLAMFGWSAGGFMTSWTVTQTHRYKAAIEGAGITDWLSFVPTSDLAQIDYDARSHITDVQAFLQYSAIMYADRVMTPLLILHGESDVRVPTFQGREFFVFLRELGKTVRMVTYPGSPHFPHAWEQRRDVFDEVFAWLKTYDRADR
ncbi:MAG TPA: prolyl oligopeptidase family serine peptidase [Candidatus Baltobacteraceae bacterium]|nr:prolyl oligopeptidase family serine peptidase [Candidatus Baltobacteraceae bacterium]